MRDMNIGTAEDSKRMLELAVRIYHAGIEFAELALDQKQMLSYLIPRVAMRNNALSRMLATCEFLADSCRRYEQGNRDMRAAILRCESLDLEIGE